MNQYPVLFEEGFLWPLHSQDLKPSDYFLCGYLKDRVFQKHPNTISELKICIQSGTEAIFTETLTTALKNFILHLHEVCDLWGHHMKYVLV